MILAGAPAEDVTICDTNDIAAVFRNLDQINTDVIYILTNPKHAKDVKGYLMNGGDANG